MRDQVPVCPFHFAILPSRGTNVYAAVVYPAATCMRFGNLLSSTVSEKPLLSSEWEEDHASFSTSLSA